MIIKVDENIQLDKITMEDKYSLIKYINHPTIYRNTLTIPYPYTENDADWWIMFVHLKEREEGKLTNWTIRMNGELIGGLGLLLKYPEVPGRDEFGYWLGEPFWNKGIMTKVVKAFSDFCFKELKYLQLEAPVFHYNNASAKVLTKAGFKFIMDIHNKYQKDGRYEDAKLYIKTYKDLAKEDGQLKS
jgi:[ribosomal protein S5]-alanine N-acetyltransferase